MSIRRYYKEARFENFRTFCKVAWLQSYARGARALGLSRPTVWQQIDSLERELGAKLLVRSGRGVIATEAGRLLLELVQPNVAAMDSLKQAFQARLADQGGVLRVAVITGMELYETLVRFRMRHPRIHLSLVERRSIDVVKLVEDGECDVGLGLFSPEMPRSPLVHYEPISERRFALMVARTHPLARSRRLRLADIVAHPLAVFTRGNPLRVQVERVFDREGLLPRMQIALETDTREISEHFAYRGLAAAIVTLAPTQKPLLPVAFLPLTQHFGSLPLCLMWENGAHLLPHVAAFVEMAKQALDR
jgi:DNA-binding transcriptional LysR family regulator